MHPIIPILETHIGFPIAYAEALEMVSDAQIPDDFLSLIMDQGCDDGHDVHEEMLLMALFHGGLKSLVYSPAHNRWGRLPAVFWPFQRNAEGALARGIFQSSGSKLLAHAMGDISAFDGSPIMLIEDEVRTFRANLDLAADEQRGEEPRAPNPVTTMASVVRCRQWLKEQFAIDQSGKLTRPQLKAGAMELFQDLTGRGFDRSWREATEDHPERRAAGRPRN